MKNKKIIMLSLFSSIVLGGCKINIINVNNTNSSNISNTITDSETINNQIDITKIKDLRDEKNTGEIVTIKGVVVKHNYTDQSTPYITGFWIADETGSIYIYGEKSAKTVQEGNLVTVKGTKGFYIPNNDTGAAISMNYTGMMQLTNPEILDNDGKKNEIPSSAITETTISEINKIPLSINISGNIYKVKGSYSRVAQSDFVNYYLNDFNKVDSIMAYTQSNGKDYKWTDGYDGKNVEMLIIISLAKPGVNSWRMCPVAFLNDDIKVSDEDEATYAAQRVLSKFSSTYNVDTLVEIPKEEEKLSGSEVSITSTSNNVLVTENNNILNVNILTSTLGKFEITVTVKYKTATISLNKEVEIIKKSDFETISISEVKNKEDGTIVTIEAVVAKVTYKSSMTKQGLFLVDDSSSIFAYFGTSIASQLENVEEGNKIVLKAKVDHYIKNATNALNENYSGDFQLSNGEILNIDSNVYEIPVTSYSNSTVTTIALTKPENNITGNIYKVRAIVVKNVSTNATSYNLKEVNDLVPSGTTAASIPLYSQNSGNDFKWLDEYEGEEVTILVGVQNLNLKASGSYYRCCPIKVL